MVVNRPSIILYCCQPDEDYLREVCAGIEEEGVLYQVISRSGEVDDLAFEAAADSMLGSGIGICGKRLAMQMQYVPRGKNVFELDTPSFAQCRSLGANSARAIKKMVFKPVYNE